MSVSAAFTFTALPEIETEWEIECSVFCLFACCFLFVKPHWLCIKWRVTFSEWEAWTQPCVNWNAFADKEECIMRSGIDVIEGKRTAGHKWQS